MLLLLGLQDIPVCLSYSRFFRRRLSALLECAGEQSFTCHVRYFVACSRVTVTAWQKRCELRLRNACVWCTVTMFRSCLHLSQHQHQTARLTKTQKIYTRKEIICLCLLKYTSHFPPLFFEAQENSKLFEGFSMVDVDTLSSLSSFCCGTK